MFRMINGKRTYIGKKARFENYSVYKLDEMGDNRFHEMTNSHKTKQDAIDWANGNFPVDHWGKVNPDNNPTNEYTKYPHRFKIKSTPMNPNHFSDKDVEYMINEGRKMKK